MAGNTGLNRSDRRKVQQAIDRSSALYRERQTRTRRWPVAGGSAATMRIGLLDEALTAPASITAAMPTANVSRHDLDADTGQFVDSGETDEVSNPFVGLTGASGATIGYFKYSSIWLPFWVDCTEQDEQQTMTITGSPTGGTFTLAYQGETTSALNHNSSAATVQSALEALSSIGSGNVSCSGGDLPGTAVVVTFQGTLENTDTDPLMADGSGLTGGTSPAVTVEETTKGCCG